MLDFIENLDIGIKTYNDRNTDDRSLALSALPGGKVTATYYDGIQDKQLNYELTGKVEANNRNELIAALDKIVSALENSYPQITSSNRSFESPAITVTSAPYYSDATTDGFIYFRVTIQVVLTVFSEGGR